MCERDTFQFHDGLVWSAKLQSLTLVPLAVLACNLPYEFSFKAC